LGRSMVGPEPNLMGINRDRVITDNYIYDIGENRFFPIPGKPLPNSLPDPEILNLRHHQLAGISWWRIMRGSALKQVGSSSQDAITQ
jgi:hypothetical protein